MKAIIEDLVIKYGDGSQIELLNATLIKFSIGHTTLSIETEEDGQSIIIRKTNTEGKDVITILPIAGNKIEIT